MICTGQPTLLRNFPRFVAPRALCLRYGAGSPAPISLRALAMPIKPAVPTSRATPSLFTAYPSFRLFGSAGANTLIGATLLVHRHFSIARKPEENEGTAEITVSTKKPATPAEPRTIHAPNKVIIAQVPWGYTLYKVADQYILSVVCGTIAIYSLEIPLDARETAQALEGTASLDALAAKIQYSPSSYHERRVCLD